MEQVEVLPYLDLVDHIARNIAKTLPHSVDLNDLKQAGALGLLDASRRYNQKNGASFRTYAGIRIRGQILDELRSYTWLPRSVTKKVREANSSLQELNEFILVSYEEVIEEIDIEDPYFLDAYSNYKQEVLLKDLKTALSNLSNRDKDMIMEYYFNEKMLKQIAVKYRISESRTCQIIKDAVKKLGNSLSKWN